MVDRLAEALSHLREYRLAFQLIEWEAVDDDDDYTLYERIGRGGVQITPRQLAVSKLMLALGRDGNDAVIAFQSSVVVAGRIVVVRLAAGGNHVCAFEICSMAQGLATEVSVNQRTKNNSAAPRTPLERVPLIIEERK
ncbi:MAG TPA: hypothetical protein VGV87_24105 [Blastocatellia bacterium]|nr:hypothetical protein [Blastocatellia bacterium]